MIKINNKLKWIGISGAVILFTGIVILEILFQISVNKGVKVVDLPRESQVSLLNVNSDYADAYLINVADTFNVSNISAYAAGLGKEVFRNGSEIVVEGTAPGLTFYASFYLDEDHNLTLSTVVFYKSLLGQIYFAPVKVIHKHALPYFMYNEFGRPAGV